MNTKLLIVIIMLFIGMSSCSKWLENEKLTLQKTPYTGNELRTDGYYYDMEDGKIWSTYFFYRNGILHCGIASDTLGNNLNMYDTWFASDFYLQRLRTDRRRCGDHRDEDPAARGHVRGGVVAEDAADGPNLRDHPQPGGHAGGPPGL